LSPERSIAQAMHVILGDGCDLEQPARHDTGLARLHSGPAHQIGGAEPQQSSQTVIALSADAVDAGLLVSAQGALLAGQPIGGTLTWGDRVLPGRLRATLRPVDASKDQSGEADRTAREQVQAATYDEREPHRRRKPAR
jgi:hypothetical protein